MNDVARWRLCIGCGACAFACEKKNIILEDVIDTGIRPTFCGTECGECTKCIEVCPGLGVNHDSQGNKEIFLTELRESWGPVLEVWEGHAADPEVRYLGSSGGAATTIALYCLETRLTGGVLHIGKDEGEPWRNRGVISRTRQDLLFRTGSRYSPASVCDGLEAIHSVSKPIVFLGKPCDVQGLKKTQSVKEELAGKIGLAIGIFCAGTPSTLGTLELLKSLKIDAKSVEEVRYRGKGWPGKFSVKLKGEEPVNQEVSYRESWGFLQRYRPFRCYLCPDGTSEFADISCGDPWYREIKENDPGYSLVLVRTEKGRKVLRGHRGRLFEIGTGAPRYLSEIPKRLTG